jgi:hypothetical protein
VEPNLLRRAAAAEKSVAECLLKGTIERGKPGKNKGAALLEIRRSLFLSRL